MQTLALGQCGSLQAHLGSALVQVEIQVRLFVLHEQKSHSEGRGNRCAEAPRWVELLRSPSPTRHTGRPNYLWARSRTRRGGAPVPGAQAWVGPGLSARPVHALAEGAWELMMKQRGGCKRAPGPRAIRKRGRAEAEEGSAPGGRSWLWTWGSARKRLLARVPSPHSARSWEGSRPASVEFLQYLQMLCPAEGAVSVLVA